MAITGSCGNHLQSHATLWHKCPQVHGNHAPAMGNRAVVQQCCTRTAPCHKPASIRYYTLQARFQCLNCLALPYGHACLSTESLPCLMNKRPLYADRNAGPCTATIRPVPHAYTRCVQLTTIHPSGMLQEQLAQTNHANHKIVQD